MNDAVRLLALHGPLLVAGVTMLLTLGCLFMAVTSSPAHRRTVGELTIVAALAWAGLAWAPLPRLLSFPRYSSAPLSELPADHRVDEVDDAEKQDAAFLQPNPLEVEPIREKHAAASRWGAAVVKKANLDEPLVVDKRADVAGKPAEHQDDATAENALDNQVVAEIESLAPIATVWRATLPHEERARFELGDLLVMAYLVGVAACGVWLVLGHVLLARLYWTSHRPELWLGGLFESLAIQQPRRPRLVTSRTCSRPLSWGLWRPVIVLPQTLCRPGNEAQLKTVLLHELGHVAHGDAAGNLLLNLAFPLLYAHPLYWWLRRAVRMAGELLADDWAAQQTGKESYVEQLVALAKSTRGRVPLVPATSVLSCRSEFYRRMAMLLARPYPLATTTKSVRAKYLTALATIVAVATFGAGVHTAPAQEGDEKAPSPAIEVPAAAEEAAVADPLGGSAQKEQLSEAVKPPPGSATYFERSLGHMDEERASLEAEIKKLQDRLQALEARRGERVLQEGSTPPSRTGERQVEKLIQDREGRLWLKKYVRRADGKERLIASELVRDDEPQAKSDHGLSGRVERRPRLETAPRGGGEDQAKWAGGKQLDLIGLATSYADAVTEVEVAEAELAPMLDANAKVRGAVGSLELNIAQAKLSGAKRKERLLRQIAEAATAHARQEAEIASSLYKTGHIHHAAAMEAESRLETLERILAATADSGGTGKTSEDAPKK